VAEKIKIYENLALEIKNMRKFNNIFIDPFLTSAEEVPTKNFLQYPENIGLIKNILRLGQKAVLLYVCDVCDTTSYDMPPDLRGWDDFPFDSLA
jgi:hypothetical protein